MHVTHDVLTAQGVPSGSPIRSILFSLPSKMLLLAGLEVVAASLSAWRDPRLPF